MGLVSKRLDPKDDHIKFILNDLEWLIANNLLVDDDMNVMMERVVETGMFDPTLRETSDPDEIRQVEELEALTQMSVQEGFEFQDLIDRMNSYLRQERHEEAQQYYYQAMQKRKLGEEYRARTRSLFLNLPSSGYDIIAVPILEQLSELPKINTIKIKKANVFNVILTQIPVPDETNPWEAILAFKEDADTVSKLRSLRIWVSDVARTDFDVHEIEDRLLSNLEDYKKSLANHKLKVEQTFLKTIILPGAEVLENIIKLKFSKAIEAYISWTERKVELSEAETNIKHKELAYINKVNEKFGS